MKHTFYKKIIALFAIGFITSTFAQKFDKKFSENFTVNKDVEVAINASNTEINVTTWNKNQVQVEAFIEIEGVTKDEAEKYFKNWNFEALGNSSKVKITSKENNLLNLRNDFVMFNDMDFTFPDIQMPNFDNIVIPEMDFNFDFDFGDFMEDFDEIEKDMHKNGKYFFNYNDDENSINIKTKKEWETFKKSKKYQELREKMAKEKIEMKKGLAISKEKMKKDFEKAKKEFQSIDKEKIRNELAKAKAEIMKMKLNFNSDNNDFMIDGKKIKIKKRLEIKVPEKATFNLNTRHCKVKLPDTVAFGSVKYGTFNANNLNGGMLTIDYSKVSIDNLNGCNLFLNNVTDAKIVSVTNTKMNNNSSGVHIVKINENVDLSNKFGELKIISINPNYKSFKLLMDSSEAVIDASNITTNLVYNVGDKSPDFVNKASAKFNLLNMKTKDLNGNFSIKTKDNSFLIQGKYSQLTIKK